MHLLAAMMLAIFGEAAGSATTLIGFMSRPNTSSIAFAPTSMAHLRVSNAGYESLARTCVHVSWAVPSPSNDLRNCPRERRRVQQKPAAVSEGLRRRNSATLLIRLISAVNLKTGDGSSRP
jgi:hypothetical protein